MTENTRWLIGRLRDGIGKVGDRCVAAVMPSYGHRVGRDNSGQALENDSMRRLAPSLAEIEELANRALATIPRPLKRHLGGVVIRVEEFPDQATSARLGLESPFNLLGLYHGVPMPRRSVSYPPPYPDMIYLYRRPILHYWCGDGSGQDLADVVQHVLIHEIGHHFGFSDEDMERIEAAG
jgi:predicted Zn-dependent protease with MMP-like domain